MSGRHRFRYRDAGEWTSWVADDGAPIVDPLGTSDTGPRGLARVPWSGRIALGLLAVGFLTIPMTLVAIVGSMDQPSRVVRNAERAAIVLTYTGIACYAAALVLGMWAFVIWVHRHTSVPPLPVAMFCALIYALAIYPAYQWWRYLTEWW